MSNLISNNTITWENYNFNYDTNLKPNEVHIFKISIDIYDEVKYLFKEILQNDELQKAEKFKQFDDKKRFLIGKLFSKILISKQLNHIPSEIIFSFTKFNKPVFKNFHFNVSHSGNYITIILSAVPVGIDVELIKVNFDYKPLLPECFNKTEIEKINDIMDFYTFWTRKEALLKATGEGLVDNLTTIDSSLIILNRLGNSYKLASLLLDDSYLLSSAILNGSYEYKYWNVAFKT